MRFLRSCLILAWSLWFGGMIALLIFVIQLFKTSHDTGVLSAPVLFRTFAVYQIVLGSIALLLSLISRLRFATIFISIALGIALPVRMWTNRMDSLRVAGQSQNEEFKSLHGKSSIAYTASAIALLLAGIAISFSGPARGARREELP